GVDADLVPGGRGVLAVVEPPVAERLSGLDQVRIGARLALRRTILAGAEHIEVLVAADEPEQQDDRERGERDQSCQPSGHVIPPVRWCLGGSAARWWSGRGGGRRRRRLGSGLRRGRACRWQLVVRRRCRWGWSRRGRSRRGGRGGRCRYG